MNTTVDMATSTEVNQQYFNKIASEYDQRFARSFTPVLNEIQENLDFIGVKKGGRFLDYACGTGFMSICLGETVSQCVGVDITENMVGAYNFKAAEKNIPEDNRKAYLGNLLSTPTSPSLDGALFRNFDVAGVGMGFHHFPDVALAAARLTERLSVGGSLFILDFLPHSLEGHEHTEKHGVHHAGFDEAHVKGLFEGAGAGRDFAYKALDSVVVFENMPGQLEDKKMRLFLARGTKTA